MADGLPLPVWVHDAGGAQAWVNRTYTDSFGISPAQLPSSDWVDLTHPDDVCYVEEFMASIQVRAPFHGHVRMQDTQGEWRWLESWAKPRAAADGGYLGHIGASADVTERRALEEAERFGRRRAELLADMSDALETALDPASRISRLLDIVVPRFADYAAIEAPRFQHPCSACDTPIQPNWTSSSSSASATGSTPTKRTQSAKQPTDKPNSSAP